MDDTTDFIRPRLSDHYGIPLLQSKVDFAIPYMDEDIPLYVDPFLLWKSPSQMDNGQHLSVITAFNELGRMYLDDKQDKAIETLIYLSECAEVGLGTSNKRMGRPISTAKAKEVLDLFQAITQLSQLGFKHIEQIQLLVQDISKDRISDIACSLMKSFLIDYTIQECKKYGIPLCLSKISYYDTKKKNIVEETTNLPINEKTEQCILFVPKRWLRFSPWLNYDSYYKDYIIADINKEYDGIKNRIQILEYNRHHFDQVEKYISIKELAKDDCKNDPLFSKISKESARRKVCSITKLYTGKKDNADKKYEELMGQVLTSLLYPHLDFAQEQSRIVSGTQIRDLIFYNNIDTDFLKELYDVYDCRQIVVELKNVHSIEREHINQLNRYMSGNFGRFGILFTRNKPSKQMLQNTIDLWSGQRRCILIMTDDDLKLMQNINSNEQRKPIEVIKKKYVEFTRLCPN